MAISVIGMDEEEMLKRITRLLEQGGTMLATHHTCGAPEFRYRGQVVCPVCSFREEGAPEDKESEKKERPSEPVQSKAAKEEKTPVEGISIESPSLDKAVSYAGTTAHEGLSTEEADLRRVVLSKIKELASGIEREQDLDKMRKQFDCAEAALRALRLMQR